MNTEQTLLELIRALPAEKQQEVLAHAQSLRAGTASVKAQRKNGRGLWAGLGIDWSSEDIDSARREMQYQTSQVPTIW